MTFIPPGILADARNLVDSSLPDSCTVQRAPGGVDSTGAPSKAGATPVTVHANVPCRLKDYGSSDRPHFDILLVTEQVSEVGLYVLLVSVGADIKVRDVILVNGLALNVLGTDAATSWSAGMHVLLKEVGS